MDELRQSLTVPDPHYSPFRAGAVEQIQWFTIAWMAIEAGISLFAAIRANSVALEAFGADSAIELFSAAIVLWGFRSRRQQAEALATKHHSLAAEGESGIHLRCFRKFLKRFVKARIGRVYGAPRDLVEGVFGSPQGSVLVTRRDMDLAEGMVLSTKLHVTA